MSKSEIKTNIVIDDKSISKKLMSQALGYIILSRIEKLPIDEKVEAYYNTLATLKNKKNNI